MGHYRVKEEQLGRIQLGLRYVGLDIGQFYWQCLKLVAASEELTETDILRRIIRSWSETLPPAVREKARTETTRLEAWKTQELRTREKPNLKLIIQNEVDVFCSGDGLTDKAYVPERIQNDPLGKRESFLQTRQQPGDSICYRRGLP